MSVPQVLKVEDFETLRESFISDFFLPHAVKEVGEELASEMVAGLRSPNEVSALLLDCMVLYGQQNTRNENYKALQQFSATATDSEMIDLIVSRFSMKRQVIQQADNTVYPPKAAVMESDASLLLRYSLAPYGLATTGTRTGYRFHALTLGARPVISVEVESETVVNLRYQFSSTDGVERPKDAAPKMIEPNSGKVEVRILAFDGNGTANEGLISAVDTYLNRDDVAQETDEISVKSAAIIDHQIVLECSEVNEPGQLIERSALLTALKDYADKQHRLGGTIQRSKLDQIAHNHNASTVKIIQPVNDVVCDWFEAPYCTGVTLNVV